MGMNTVIFLAVDPEVINKALLNTVMCITVVFALLIFFTVVISFFKYISKAEAHFKKGNASDEPLLSDALESEPEDEIYEEEYDDLSDDLELTAVITAAIYTYEEAQGTIAPADGLVVRSIRKINKSKWQNA